jgi:L-lactate utilization protein LutB
MSSKKQYYENLANTMIANLNKRGFEAAYTSTKEEALEKAMSYLSPGKTVACGGSKSLGEIGFTDALKESDCVFLDRFSAKTDAERDEIFSKIAICDYYYMSTNAITVDGQLVNIDGSGNRVASLIHGPKNVVIITGMNKVCADVESAYQRVKLSAAPPNTVRLHKKTPCAMTGKCGDCLSPDCICTHTVITRRSNIPNRIKIILVGEELGF